MNEMLLYPGCAIPSKLPFVESAARFVLDKLEIPFADFPGFTCCVEPVGLRSLGLETWMVAGARLHTIATKREGPILTLCDGCTLSLQEVAEVLDSGSAEIANEVLKEMGMNYSGRAEVTGFLPLLHSRLDSIVASAVGKVDMRFGIHPGCHGDHMAGGREGAQRMLADVVEALGGEAVLPRTKVCCGGSLTSVNDDVAKGVSQEALDEFSDADALITSCPFCFLQFDTVTRGKKVIHVAELVASCLGWDVDYMSHHRTRD